MIPLSCLGDGLGPIGMVERVGIELGLQGDARTKRRRLADLAKY